MTSVHFTDYTSQTNTWLNFTISPTSLHFTTPYQTDSDFILKSILNWSLNIRLTMLQSYLTLTSLYFTTYISDWSDFTCITWTSLRLTWHMLYLTSLQLTTWYHTWPGLTRIPHWLWLYGYLTDLQLWSFAIWLWYMIWLYYISLLTYQTNLTSLD